MLFLTCLSSEKVPEYKAMMSRQNMFGMFLNPEKWSNLQTADLWDVWALDNGAFTGFKQDKFYRVIERLIPMKARCKFIVVPDVPFDWDGTLKKYMDWQGTIHRMGFPRAIAVQDGATVTNVPWNDVDVIFIGGSTQWKREHYRDLPMFPNMLTPRDSIIQEAKKRGKWIHFGRQANSRKQLIQAWKMRADSVDGTCERFEPSGYFRRVVAPTMWEIHQQINLENTRNNIIHLNLPSGVASNA